MENARYYSIVMHSIAQQFNEAAASDEPTPYADNAQWLGLPRGIAMGASTPVWAWVDTQSVWLAVFTADDEDESMSAHFSACGWTQTQINKLRKFAWFCARVDLYCLPLEGVEISPLRADPALVQHVGTEYLGACCYTTVNEFVDTPHRADYLLDLMGEAVRAAPASIDAEIKAPVLAWFKAQRELRYLEQQARKPTGRGVKAPGEPAHRS